MTIFGWVSGVVGVVMMLLGVISVFAGGIFLNHMWSNYFYPGGMFVVLGIFLFQAVRVNRICDCNCDCHSKE